MGCASSFCERGENKTATLPKAMLPDEKNKRMHKWVEESLVHVKVSLLNSVLLHYIYIYVCAFSTIADLP